MRWELAGLIALAACGRVGFDPIEGWGDDGGGPNGSNDMLTLPPGGEDCAKAKPITFGTAGKGTMAGAVDDFNGFGCGDGTEIVYRVAASTFGIHRITLRPTFEAALIHATDCPPTSGQCTSGSMSYDGAQGFDAGTHYLIIEKIGGTGVTFDFSIE